MGDHWDYHEGFILGQDFGRQDLDEGLYKRPEPLPENASCYLRGYVDGYRSVGPWEALKDLGLVLALALTLGAICWMIL